MNDGGLAADAPSPIDPLARSRPGEYHDELLSVRRTNTATAAGGAAPVVRTEHFLLSRDNRRLWLWHELRPHDLDNDVARLLVDELFAPGWLSGNEVFERAFTGIVLSTVDEPLEAWNTFYENTLRRIRQLWPGAAASRSRPGHSSIADIAPVYARVLELVPPGTVVDLGSCFGFLALLMAARARNSVIASDLVPGTVNLLSAVAAHRQVPLRTLVCDAAWVPLPDGAADTVTVVHLLEHLDERSGTAVLAEALRLATQRVIVAVPFESEPNAAYGHLRIFDLNRLHALGMDTGYRFSVAEYHGGWLIIDKAEPVPAPR